MNVIAEILAVSILTIAVFMAGFTIATTLHRRDMAFLRDLVTKRQEHEHRVDRAVRGLPEEPVERRDDPIPETILEIVNLFGPVGTQMISEIRSNHRGGVPWSVIEANLRTEIERQQPGFLEAEGV